MVNLGHSDQAEVIEFLLNPASHDGQEVTRIDTHISIVFLAGNFAYKLKRAVRYSYLDYRSIEDRRRACEAEVALNRRTAPEIYLRALPISRTPGGALRFDGDGAAVDWVVAMRRFDDNLLFDRLAQRKELTLDQVLELAAEIADFHRSAEIDRQAGGAAAIADVIRGNLANLSAHMPGIFDAADIDELRRRSKTEMRRVESLLDRRRAAGHVRLCHGDLHLRNVCLIAGRPVLFDCIEFSRELACIDVLYDLAFLLMDLEERRLRALANAVFNRYLDLTDESNGIPAIPLFLSVRAAVRAHVTAAQAKIEAEPSANNRLVNEARQYLQLALALVQPVPPALIAVGGLSGTGKTTLAYSLAPRLGAAPGARVVRTDVLRKRLAGQPVAVRLPATAYTEAATRQVYDAVLAETEHLLSGGGTALADGVFAQDFERDSIEEIARRHNALFIGLWLEAPLPVLEQRVRQRRGDASDATVEVVRRQHDYDTGDIAWSRVEASGAPQDVAERAWAVIQPLLQRR